MKITDLKGCIIEVTDIKKAIKMAGQYKEYHHENKGFSGLDKRQKNLLDGHTRETLSN